MALCLPTAAGVIPRLAVMSEKDRTLRSGAEILGAHIDAVSWGEAMEAISRWAAHRESRYVCVCNVHSVVTAQQDIAFKSIINGADMSTPDGMPLAWMLRAMGFPHQQRIYGAELMWRLCGWASATGQSVYLYGSTTTVLEKLQGRLRQAFPILKIAGAYSPPFGEISEEEDRRIVEEINRSGAPVIFVGLGCPKQERWMAGHRGRIQATMIGVGAAFDFHAGTITQAPLWMRNAGLEWFYRLMTEPRRLWRRYLYNNSMFVYYVIRERLRRSDRAA